MFEDLDIVDWAQVISGISAAIAAILSFVTTLQNRKANKRMEEERHSMVKPIFIVRGTFEKRIEKQIDFDIKNIGFDRLQYISVLWRGTEGVKVKIIKEYESETRDYVIKMDYKEHKNKEENINGKLILAYTNILGKRYTEDIEIVINKKYYELVEEYNPELQRVIGETFS